MSPPAHLALLAVAVLTVAGPQTAFQSPSDLDALARKVREVIRLEYSDPPRFDYLEQGREVDVSMLGKVSLGPLETFEVRWQPAGEPWRRLIAVDGKPLEPAELARHDEEHRQQQRRRMARERAETPRQRQARLEKAAAERRERDEILDDGERVYAFGFLRRETIDGQPIAHFSLTPRAHARVTTGDGQRMKQFAGMVSVSERDYRIVRVRLHATRSVSVGWGVVARVEPGSGFELVRKRVGDSWVMSALTIEGSGRTLLFRKFQIKTVTTYSDHRPSAPPEP
jgi:hypothetical protein